MTNKLFKAVIAVCVVLFLALLYHNVPKKVSQADKVGLEEIFGLKHVNGEDLAFEDQISFIHGMVNTLHTNYVVGFPIAYNANREPSQLVLNGGGLCYDFSRTIEKYLIYNSFQTRHVAVYLKHGSFWNTITTKGVYSHSLTEVKTANGWMIIDSNLKFYALDDANIVYAYKDLEKLEESPSWKLYLEDGGEKFYSPDVKFVYGLYSRHGRFYKPYNFIPDYNLKELFYNF
jgi:hypothetical protein